MDLVPAVPAGRLRSAGPDQPDRAGTRQTLHRSSGLVPRDAGDQLTHLFLILVVLIAVYLLVYVLPAVFDAKNSLFAFPDFSNSNILYKSELLPKLSGLTFEKFGKLFDGVTIPL